MSHCVPLVASALKGESDQEPDDSFLRHHFFSKFFATSAFAQQSFSSAMATSHPHLFLPSVSDESEICNLVANHFLLNRAVLQWRPATREDIPTPNTNEIQSSGP
jgi:hypothetical protein